MSAISGLDIALWDLKGKRLSLLEITSQIYTCFLRSELDVPVSSLLGGRVRNKIKVYSWIGGDRPSDIANAAKARRDAGYKAVKMNATEGLGWLDSPDALNEAVKRLQAARNAGVDVGLDFHGRVHLPMAKQLAVALAPHKPLFIEEPLLHNHISEIAKISKLCATPIALGERLYTRHDFRPYLEAGAVDIVQPDVSHAGGISEMRRIASLAEAYDVGFAPHCPNGPIALAASLTLDATTPNFVIQESSLGIHYNQGADLLTYVKVTKHGVDHGCLLIIDLQNQDIFAVMDGMVDVPSGPGLGIEIDEELVRKDSVDAPAWRNPVWRAPDGGLQEW